MNCPPAPKKIRKIRARRARLEPTQLFPEVLILKGLFPDLYVLSGICDVCKYIPINQTASCEKSHSITLDLILKKNTNIDFEVYDNYIAFPIEQESLIDPLLTTLNIGIQTMDIKEKTLMEFSNDFEETWQELFHDNDCEKITDETVNKIVSTIENWKLTDKETQVLREFNEIIQEKRLHIPEYKVFRSDKGSLFLMIESCMINITLQKSGQNLVSEVGHMLSSDT